MDINARNSLVGIFVLSMLLLLIQSCYIVDGESYNVSIDLQIIPEEDTGIVYMSVKYNGVLENKFVSIPLLPEASIQIVSVEDPSGNNLTYSFSPGKNELTVFVNGTDEIDVKYIISDLVNEVGIGLYVLQLDLSPYTGASNFKSTILLLSRYDVSIIGSGGYSIRYLDDTTEITVLKPDTYTIIINASKIPVPTTSKTPGEGEGGSAIYSQPWFTPSIIALASILAIALILYYRKRVIEPEVVTVPPGKLLEDETVKEIILAAGDAGSEGIKQSQLVRLTGRPKSTISRRLRRLAEEGYVEIIRSGKYNIVRLTGKGLEIYKKLKGE